MAPPARSSGWRRAAVAAALGAALPRAGAFCPKGFGDPAYFPKEWKIPVWPELSPEDAGKLRTVTFEGFKNEKLNEEFLEGPTREFYMQGQETYWQVSGEYFLYYCMRFNKWRIAGISAFGKNMNGECFGFVSDGEHGRDILDPKLIKGWIEVENGEWVRRDQAGVANVGTLQQQLDAAAAEANATDNAECSDEVGENGEKKSDCPVMPVVRKVGSKIGQAAKLAGKWVRRLFPSFLPAPTEDEEAEEAPAGAGAQERAPDKSEL